MKERTLKMNERNKQNNFIFSTLLFLLLSIQVLNTIYKYMLIV